MLRNGKIFIGIPILNRLDLLVNCLDALDYPRELVIVNNNTVDPSFLSAITMLCASKNATLLNQHRNLGVSASWNLILRTAFERGYEWVFIGSNDTTLHPGSLKAAVEMDKALGGGIWQLCKFNFFLIPRRTVKAVGWFDENFYPAYMEDQDYRYCCTLAGLKNGDCAGNGGAACEIRHDQKQSELCREMRANAPWLES